MGSSSSKPAESSKDKGRGNDQSLSEITEQRDRAIRSVQTLRAQFRSGCSHRDCLEISPSLDYDKIFDTWLAGSQVIPPRSQFSTWTCTQGHLTCVGCCATPKLDSENFFTSLGVVNHCCERGRQFTVWFHLAHFDSLCLQYEANSEKKSRANMKAKPKAKSKVKAGAQGVGYGPEFGGEMSAASWADMMDEEGSLDPYTMIAKHHASLALNADRNEDVLDQNASQDDLLMDTVKILSACLPPVDSNAMLELDMFRLSMLFDKITQLIRNDSIVDITERPDVYRATAEFVTKIANHPNLVHLLFEDRPNKANTPGLGDLSLPSHISLRGIDGASSVKPLVACYDDTFSQVKIFLELSRNPKTLIKAANTRRSKETDRLLQDLVKCFETLDTVVSRNAASKIDAQPEDTWVRFADANKVTFTDDVLLCHRYIDNFTLFQTSNRGRLTTISKEIAMLKTSLPPGIFLKVAESRSDVMKVLIIGSEGTPYAGGLFTFDIFLDERYPATPPKMTFTLHGNDEDGESFNPNLHIHTGTVCLSLLNTWPGHPSEAWQPYKSTILSVLVSVQAMILGAPMPWENEPGFEGSGATPRNIAHKARVESRTLRFGMIAWLENKFTDPKAKDYIWKDISQMYHLHNGLKVLDYVRKWVAKNPGLLNFGPTAYWLQHVKGFVPRLPEGMSQTNLVEKVSNLLGITYDPAAFPTVEIRVKEPRPKRKPVVTKNATASSKKLKGSTIPPPQFKWTYAQEKTVKVLKKACKEFGIAYVKTIKASVEKLEAHVNENMDLADEYLLDTWGEMVLISSQSTPSHQDLEDDEDIHTSADWQKEIQKMVGSSELTPTGMPPLGKLSVHVPTTSLTQVSVFGPTAKSTEAPGYKPPYLPQSYNPDPLSSGSTGGTFASPKPHEHTATHSKGKGVGQVTSNEVYDSDA